MALALGTTALAGGYSITIENSAPNHVYEAYQIFKGDLSDSVLSNIKWGTGVDQEMTVDGKLRPGPLAARPPLRLPQD